MQPTPPPPEGGRWGFWLFPENGRWPPHQKNKKNATSWVWWLFSLKEKFSKTSNPKPWAKVIYVIVITLKQFELFLLLARRPNKVFSREKIYNKIWGDTIVSDRTIDVHITRIRNKLKIDCIKSVKGVGYKFVLDT